jgi:hypothetical protein
MRPPTVGANSGATPMTSMRREITRAAGPPVSRSRMTAIAVMPAAALPTPWTKRSAMSMPIVGASMHSSDATTCRAMPTSAGRRRPKRSDIGPTRSCPRAAPSSTPEMVSATAASEVPSSAATVGSDGRYMSTVTAPRAAMAPRRPTKAGRNARSGAGNDPAPIRSRAPTSGSGEIPLLPTRVATASPLSGGNTSASAARSVAPATIPPRKSGAH